MSEFHLGLQSLDRLRLVHPLLSACVCLAIKKTAVDFSVVEGVRSVDRQKWLIDEGKSQTMNSKHLVHGGDGYGRAVDLVPLVNGKAAWENASAFNRVKDAMFSAAEELGVELRWGNDWDGDGIPVAQDKNEHFADSPHFELKGV